MRERGVPALHTLVVGTFSPMLASLRDWIARAPAGKRASRALVETTLAPEMYGFGKQVRVACAHAVESASRLAQIPLAPLDAHPGDDTSALEALLDETTARLRALPQRAFRGAETRTLVVPLEAGMTMTMTGERFARDWALPLFYFHVVLAYGMARHAGVPLGTRDYLQHIGDAIDVVPAAPA